MSRIARTVSCLLPVHTHTHTHTLQTCAGLHGKNPRPGRACYPMVYRFWGSHPVACVLTCIPSTPAQKELAPSRCRPKKALGRRPEVSSQPSISISASTSTSTSSTTRLPTALPPHARRPLSLILTCCLMWLAIRNNAACPRDCRPKTGYVCL